MLNRPATGRTPDPLTQAAIPGERGHLTGKAVEIFRRGEKSVHPVFDNLGQGAPSPPITGIPASIPSTVTNPNASL